MRLVSYRGGFGRIEDDHVVPMGRDLVAWLRGEPAQDGAAVALADVVLTAPVPRPEKVLCIGLNYLDHAAESGMSAPDEPVVFPKFANSVAAPGADVVVPAVATEIDYEAELGVVIGRRARAVSPDDALDHVAGYVCVNDLSSRGLQFRTSQWLMGKAIDGFLPMGPWLLTADEVPDPQALEISCRVNGEERQRSRTSEMVFSVADIVTHLSQVMTLEPGDVIATGTPPGVGMGMDPPRYLADGDEVVVAITGLGELRSRLVSGPRPGG
jgi:2-keto-4-pentenoate hydratase/2-oxohepta-3-ene-1,7-dioic acid hydratase in catechol pathway